MHSTEGISAIRGERWRRRVARARRAQHGAAAFGLGHDLPRTRGKRRVLDICKHLISGYAMLNQQNGIINPSNAERCNQAAWHRDLPYQHFVSSRPLAVNALFCIDEFTMENGATLVLPASHRQEALPSNHFINAQALAVTAPAGSFIVLDCMLFHSGGVNQSTRPRRAVNHVYSIPLLHQQIELPSALGQDFTSDASLRKLLGYEVPRPKSVAEYLAARRRKP